LLVIAEFLETLADRAPQHGVPDWLAHMASIIAKACRDMCDGLLAGAVS
jgi:hypothetical protein